MTHPDQYPALVSLVFLVKYNRFHYTRRLYDNSHLKKYQTTQGKFPVSLLSKIFTEMIERKRHQYQLEM